MTAWVEHMAGPLRMRVQRCTRCGYMLDDQRDQRFTDNPGAAVPTGWPEGRVYRRGNILTIAPPVNEPVNECRRLRPNEA